MSEIDYLFDDLEQKLNRKEQTDSVNYPAIEMIERVEIPDVEIEVIETSSEEILFSAKEREAAGNVRGKNRWLKKLLTIVALVILIVVAYIGAMVAIIYFDYKKAADEYKDFRKTYVNEYGNLLEPGWFKELTEINGDTIGWIEIPDTNVSFPIVQGQDDVYYLNHTFAGKESSFGCIYLEAKSDRSFMDANSIVFGRSLLTKTMFSALSEYASPTFYMSHPSVYIYLPDETLEYRVFACYETKRGSNTYTIGFAHGETFAEYLKTCKEKALYETEVEVDPSMSMLTLSTIPESGSQSCFIVQAVCVSKRGE